MANHAKNQSARLTYIKGHHPSDSGKTAWLGMANPVTYRGCKGDENRSPLLEYLKGPWPMNSGECKNRLKNKKEKTKYTVQKNVPLPEPRNTELVEAISRLKLGESFEFESDKRQNCYSAAKYRGMDVSIRKTDELTCRVWRTS